MPSLLRQQNCIDRTKQTHKALNFMENSNIYQTNKIFLSKHEIFRFFRARLVLVSREILLYFLKSTKIYKISNREILKQNCLSLDFSSTQPQISVKHFCLLVNK